MSRRGTFRAAAAVPISDGMFHGLAPLALALALAAAARPYDLTPPEPASAPVRLAGCTPYANCEGYYRGSSGDSVRVLDTHRQMWRAVPNERQSRIDARAAARAGAVRPNVNLAVPRFEGAARPRID